MLCLVYDSLTGNVRHFAEGVGAELGLPLGRVQGGPPAAPYLLLTYTFGTGEVPESTRRFLRAHSAGLRGVVASGSYHWGPNFARAADLIAAEYGVPVVAKLNKGGTAADRQEVLRWLREDAVARLTARTGEPRWNAGSN
ncbi:class Ib ribonucleoside-diphosphate reductase assembly flavoprotein NrdI (plasmid) [Deinococcus wulumuqiensis]|uniref:Class Ib ribonucleoside-diphosphate reductase assembly flavoprotein NrdI n=1 Tax=Deinococcus wulumuqiensis TaxID=980427 RepID=A0A345IKZ4_9DEIO|nr:class Ib ribonucleoside-diphosphate reductase assembly flavoprotein NrdI [Deinococcus wulumuqiensis]AXH00367.1 class Ib ribonucleoside-diphosphate reductase assembly flavoprotein NrdI [Deinococcus wulumuqiensis]